MVVVVEPNRREQGEDSCSDRRPPHPPSQLRRASLRLKNLCELRLLVCGLSPQLTQGTCDDFGHYSGHRPGAVQERCLSLCPIHPRRTPSGRSTRPPRACPGSSPATPAAFVVVEVCANAGWVHDLAAAAGHPVKVANSPVEI